MSEFSGPVVRLNLNGRKIIILGTAHISPESVADVKKIIEKEKPASVGVELCKMRFDSINDHNRWKNLDIVQVIRQKKIYLLMSSMILSAFQKKIGEATGISPGEEMKTALEEAKKKKLTLELIDRDIQITLKRAWQSTGYLGKSMLVSELLAAMLISIPADSKEIENMKQGDALDEVFKNIPMRYNRLKRIIVSERDEYLAESIKQAVKKLRKGQKIVVIVGAGHVKGIQDNIDRDIDLKELNKIKKQPKFVSILKLVAPIIVIGSIFFYFTGIDDPQKIYTAWLSWSVIKASFAGFMAIIMLAHPLAILSACLTAPISNFNPVLKPGWVAALLEAKFRKPKVTDFESFTKDISSGKGIFTNKVSRVFAILLLPQIGSSIGTAVALWYIAQ